MGCHLRAHAARAVLKSLGCWLDQASPAASWLAALLACPARVRCGALRQTKPGMHTSRNCLLRERVASQAPAPGREERARLIVLS